MKRLLSIDDEPGILECLRQAMEHKGYEILVSSDPDDGMRIFREEDIALVLLDVRMPRKSGFELYREMRAIRKTPVLFVTAYPGSFSAGSDEVVEMWQGEFTDGMTDIIYKPFDLATLFDKVEALIGTAEADT